MSEQVAMRFSYGDALKNLKDEFPQMIVLDADVSHSTQTWRFAQACPERFINVGIAEANMVGVAAGLAATGYLPVVNTFSFLLSERALDQIRACACVNALRIKFVGHYAGLSDSFDGLSHHAISDVAIMRAIPGMTLVAPSDANQVPDALRAVLGRNGPAYLRLCRAPTPVFHKAGDSFEIGRANILEDGADISLICSGVITACALQAAHTLRLKGIRARVVEMHTLKPLDETAVLDAARHTGLIITCEESNVFGGLFEAVSGVLAKNNPARVVPIAIEDKYTHSGPYDQLLKMHGLSAYQIAKLALELLSTTKA